MNFTPNELALFRALADGVLVPSFLYTGLLGKGKDLPGKKYLLDALTRRGGTPATEEDFQALADNAGLDPGLTAAVFNGIPMTPTVSELALRGLGTRLANAKDPYNVEELQRIIDSVKETSSRLEPLSLDAAEEKPQGIPLKTLPRLSGIAGGMMGVWIIGGLWAHGKSILARQIAYDAGFSVPVVYYDFDGKGERVFRWCVSKMFQGDLERARRSRVHYQFAVSSPNVIESQMNSFGTPGLAIVDSIQKVPVRLGQKREGIDSWVTYLQRHVLTKGHTVLLVSEATEGDEEHENARKMMFKESRGIEYAGTFSLLLTGDLQAEGKVTVTIKKDSFGTHQGRTVTLEQDRKKVFYFREV